MVDLDVKEKEAEKLEENKVEEQKVEIPKELSLNLNNKKNGKKWGIIIATIVLLLLIIMFSTIFALINVNNNKILKGIFIEDIEVSDLTKEEAQKMFEELISKKMENEIVFKYKELETPITYEALEVKFDIENAIEQAYNIGRDGNLFENNFNILKTWINGEKVKLDHSIDEDVIRQVSENINNTSEDAVVEPSYYIEDNNIIITAGKNGIKVDEDMLKQEVDKNISINSDNSVVIEVPVVSSEHGKIDLEKIHNEIYKEVKDAYYVQNPFTIYPEVNGVDFDMKNAKTIIAENKEEYTIPLIITKAQKTTQDIGTEAFPDLLATFSTKYNAGDRDRTTNLILAAQKINGTVLLPGEEFSYNKTVGERTIEAGYKMAATFSNGKVVDGLGGGICQISSTLYDAVVMANLQITKRRNHQFITSYLPGGKDATVVWGSQDFKFINSRKYPVRITMSVSGGTATAQVWGLKEEVEYDITIESQKTATIAYTTQYINDPSLPEGTQVVKQNGSNGSKYEAYKVMRLNGVVVSRTLLSKDTYNAKQKIVRIGTKK